MFTPTIWNATEHAQLLHVSEIFLHRPIPDSTGRLASGSCYRCSRSMAVSSALLGQRVCLLPYSYQPIECFQRRAALLLQIKKRGCQKRGRRTVFSARSSTLVTSSCSVSTLLSLSPYSRPWAFHVVSHCRCACIRRFLCLTVHGGRSPGMARRGRTPAPAPSLLLPSPHPRLSF